MREELAGLVEMSNRYGRDPRYVLAGGGNTSYKNEDILYVKGSGTSLASVSAQDFVSMDRSALSAMLEKEYPDTDDEREAAALADLMAARLPENGQKRPSVETLLHNLFPHTYVLHVHPAIVNGLTCSQGGEELAREVLPDDFLWIPAYRPGYALAALCAGELDAQRRATGREPNMVLLQNHGIFLAGDTVEEINALMDRTIGALEKSLARTPQETGEEQADGMREAVQAALPGAAVTQIVSGADIAEFLSSRERFASLAQPFTPDHIVYCKAEFLYVDDLDNIAQDVAAYREAFGYPPRVLCLRGVGAVCSGSDQKSAETSMALFLDAAKIAVFSESFGGPLHMPEDLVDFIKNWEMEAYRAQVAQGS